MDARERPVHHSNAGRQRRAGRYQAYDDAEQLWLDLDGDGEDALPQLQGASIRYRIAVGPIAGRKTLRLHTPGAGVEGRERTQRRWISCSSVAPAGSPA